MKCYIINIEGVRVSGLGFTGFIKLRVKLLKGLRVFRFRVAGIIKV